MAADDRLPKSAKATPEHLWGVPVEYSEEHIPEEELEAMRQQTDTTGDAMLEALLEHEPALMRQQGSAGLRSALEEVLDKHQQAAASASQRRSPRSTAAAAADPRVAAFVEHVSAEPNWLDRALLREGELVYLRYSTSASLGLMYFSLVGGFSAPKIIKVLDETGYLTRSDRNETWRRLNETIEMVLDCICADDGLEVLGAGWWAVLKVRMMHSRVRRRLLARGGARSWDKEAYGAPINQEDMMGTLLSFSINVLRAIQHTGAPWLTLREQEAYLHLWRYIGHLIGVREEFNVCTGVRRACGAVESVVQHLLMQPTPRSQQVAQRVLASVAGRKLGAMKRPWSYGMHAELARCMLGGPLADALGITASPLVTRVHAMVFLLVVRLINLVFPLLVRREGRLGAAVVRRTRAMLRWNCDTQLYPERFDSKGVAIPGADQWEPRTAHLSEVSVGVGEGEGEGGGPTCPFGFGQ